MHSLRYLARRFRGDATYIVAQSVHGFAIPDVFSKAFEDVKTAHVQEINSLELDIENMQQANNAMRIPFDDRIRDQRDCGKE